MYKNSSCPIPVPNVAGKLAASDCRVKKTQRGIDQSRMQLYLNTPSVDSLSSISPELATNGATILAQTAAGRASVVGAGTPAGPLNTGTPGEILSRAAVVESLNGLTDMNACAPKKAASVEVVKVNRPMMPQRVNQVRRTNGLAGLAGIAPPWGNASMQAQTPGAGAPGFWDWVKDHPFLSLGVVAGLVYLGTDERRKGRRRGN